MNPRDRYLAAIRGQEVDRVPLFLEGFTFPDREALLAHPDPGRREVGLRVLEHVTFFTGVPSYVNRYLVTPPQRIRVVERLTRGRTVRTTSEIDTPRGTLTAVVEENPATDTVWTLKYPVETPADLEALASVPWEPPAGLAPPDLEPLPRRLWTHGVVDTRISSPVVCVGGAMTYEGFLELCGADPALVEDLTAECARRVEATLDILLGAPGIEYVWIGGCEWLTPPMGSPALYRRLVQPYEARLIARAHAAGAVCHVHCHGNVRSTLPLVVERGADFYEPMEAPPDGDLTMAEGVALAAGRMTLGGNVEARLLAYGSPDEVAEATRAALAPSPARIVLQNTAGPLQAMSPREVANYHRMVDVWEECAVAPAAPAA